MLDWHGNSALSWRTSPSLDISSQVRLTEVSLFFYTNHCCFIITSNYYSFFRSILYWSQFWMQTQPTHSIQHGVTWVHLGVGGGGVWSTLNLAWDGNSWLHLEGALSWSECNGTMWPTFDYQMQIKTKQRCPYQ